MEQLALKLAPYLPPDFDLQSAIRFLAIAAIGSLLLGFLARAVFKKRSELNHAVTSAIGILFMYALTVVIYTFDPAGLSKFLSPLPFVEFKGDYLNILSITTEETSFICFHLVNMIILAFMVCFLDSVIPTGSSIIGWYFYRMLTVLLAMVVQILINKFFGAMLPEFILQYASMILIGILVVLFLLTLLKVVLGLALTVVNPILGAVYAFFFSNIIGKMITTACLTALMVSALVYAMDKLNFLVICIADTSLMAYLPFALVMLVVWYILGHLL